ncbi:membrane protein [Candidatus Thiomargarita nelsonii]|uniref:Membrane protein n=1 Tax=Candidatus Thiomargarita nelsonii TaxID=1003181 RepID=A0A0A6PFK5_9GAMM|nr:membrane protein [Candidatus Thiomargarita nelsonii]
MKKRHYLYLIVGLLCSVLSYPVAAELKIGVVNILKVMDKAPQVDSANRRLERDFAPRQRRLVSAQQEIKKLEERFGKDAAIMTESQARRLSRDIREKRRDLKRQQEELQEDLNIRRNEELEKIQKTIFQVIQYLAKADRYDMIFTEGVVWASKRVDLTDKVLKRLRRKKR